MAATTGYQAGIESNQVQLSYGIESTWNQAPSTTFNALRFTSETLAGSKTRSRPSEVLATREASQAVTTAEAAGGTISFALSFGTFDDLMSIALGNDWQPAQVIAGVSGDITFTSGTKVLSSTTGTKFQNISAGQYINLGGFTNTGNNGIWLVASKADDSHLTLAGTGTITTETPTGTSAQVRASTLANGTQFKSMFLQKRFASNVWLRYGGSYVSRMVLSGGVGNFMSGSFDIVSSSELSSTTDASTGGITAAPNGRVHDSIGGFGGVLWNSAALSAGLDSFSLTVENAGAAGEFAMGASIAQGMLPGSLTVTGNLKMFFKGLTEYTNFKNETFNRLTLITKDAAGNAYVVSLPQAALMNPKANDGGPGQVIYAEFDIEGNPQTGGGTISIDRLAAIS